MEDDIIEVEWFEVKDDYLVKSVGYYNGNVVGYNDFIIGDLISLVDSDSVLEKIYYDTRISGRSNEVDLQQRLRGMSQPVWNEVGPWRIVEVLQGGKLGVTQRMSEDISYSDLIVGLDQIISFEE